MLYDFNNIPNVWMHVHHSVIVSHSLYVWTMLEYVYFTNVKHIFWGNPHTISINPTSPVNPHTISYLKLRFEKYSIQQATHWFAHELHPTAMHGNAWRPFQPSLKPSWTWANLSPYWRIFRFNSFGIDILPAFETKILCEIACNSSSPGLTSLTSK